MDQRAHVQVEGWSWIVALAIGYLACALAALELAKGSGGIAFVWPASGVAVGALMVLDRRSRPPFLILIAVASLAANLLFGSSLMLSIGFTIANLIECVIADRIACNGQPGCTAFDEPRWVVRFAAGCSVAAIVSAFGASIVARGDPNFFASWVLTAFLGMLIVTPAVVMLGRAALGHRPRSVDRPLATKVGVYLAVAVLTVATFGQDRYPLLFLPLAGVVLATYALGLVGAVITVVLVAVVGSLVTAAGGGPVHFVADQQQRIILLQFFLVVLLASALPLASLLARARANAALLRLSNRLLETAERAAHVGHWRYEIGADEVLWSDEVFRIYGRETDRPFISNQDAMRATHPADRAAVSIALRLLLRTGEPCSVACRIIRPDGGLRHLETHAEVEHDEARRTIALIGVVVDVTATVETTAQLELAKSAAEREAARTTTLAETDELTGIANRRKLMDVLKTEVASCASTDRPLAFVMLDLDDFKLINDQFGHGVGDLVLRRVAEAASTCLRDTDLIGRMGGEEFGVLLPGADHGVASAVADRIRSAIEVCWPSQFGLERVTASFGVASLSENGDDTELLKAADTALYHAKRTGKNCVRLANDAFRLAS